MTRPQTPPRVPLFGPVSERLGNVVGVYKDSRLINGLAEKDETSDAVWVMKRPGYAISDASMAGQGIGLGVHNWKGDIYAVFGTHLFKNGVDKGVVNGSSAYTFTSSLGATPQLFLHNNSNAYVYDDGGGLVAVVDADYPATTVPGSVYIDGTTYVASADAHIKGSDLNTQTSWTALNDIVAQIEPDQAIAIAKHVTFLICLKEISTEIFYDKGNATGSPLAPIMGSKIGMGCRAAGSVARMGDDLAWISASTESGFQVALMHRLHAEIISTPPVERLLRLLNFVKVWGWGTSVLGHRCYVVTMPNSNITLVFDLSTGSWYFWTDTAGNYFPIVAATYASDGTPVLQHETNGILYAWSPAVYRDNGVNIPFSLYTPNYDGGARLNKMVGIGEIIADRIATSVEISWSDDDYQTYNTAQTVNLDQDHPNFQDGGSFRQRSYKLTHSDNTPLRLKALELQLSVGTL